jgi:hypothetical protein
VGGDWTTAWTAALDTLEADVQEVEDMLAADHRQRDNPITNGWKPPTGLGPLPLDLKPRADSILNRQLAAAQAVSLALATTRRQAAVAARIETGQQAAPRPAYVDCAMYRKPGPHQPATQSPCRPNRNPAADPLRRPVSLSRGVRN